MCAYPRLPVRRGILGAGQFTLLHLLLFSAICAVTMQSLLQEGLPRLLAGLFGGIVLCMAAIWLVSRLRTMLAVASLVSAFALFMLVAGGAGYLPTLAHALWRLFRDYSTDLDLMVVIGSWYAAMLLIGALIGSCLAVVRARRELYA